MLDELELELAEFYSWRAFRNVYTTCDVCRQQIRWSSSWAWVQDEKGGSVRACFDCLGKSVILLRATDLGERR